MARSNIRVAVSRSSGWVIARRSSADIASARGSRPRRRHIGSSQTSVPLARSCSQVPRPTPLAISDARSLAWRSASSAARRSVTSITTPNSKGAAAEPSTREWVITSVTAPSVRTIPKVASRAGLPLTTQSRKDCCTCARSSGWTYAASHSASVGASRVGGRPKIE